MAFTVTSRPKRAMAGIQCYLLHRRRSYFLIGIQCGHAVADHQPLDYHAYYRNQCCPPNGVVSFSIFSFFPTSEIPASLESETVKRMKEADEQFRDIIHTEIPDCLLVALVVPASASQSGHVPLAVNPLSMLNCPSLSTVSTYCARFHE